MTNINNYKNTMDSVASEELERIWDMRDKLSGVNDATLPILVQYCNVYSTIQKLTLSMNGSDYDSQWDKSLARLDKLSKILLSYVKILKLSEGNSSESSNKFAKLLLNK